MNTEIKKLIHSKFDRFQFLITNFFDAVQPEQHDGYEFKAENVNEKLISAIEEYWKEEILPLSIGVKNSNNPDEVRFLAAEFDSYYQNIMLIYFSEDYKPFSKVDKNITTQSFSELHEIEQEWYMEIEPFLRQKKYLFEFLNTCKHVIQYPEVVESKKAFIITKKDKYKTFNDIFKEPDWQKYIEALVHVKVLDCNYNFIGNPHTDKAVVGGWFRTLKDDLKVLKGDVTQSVLIDIINAEFPPIDIKGHKTITDRTKGYNFNFKERLLKYIGEKSN